MLSFAESIIFEYNQGKRIGIGAENKNDNDWMALRDMVKIW